MSARGSQTPTGKSGQRAFDYPLTPAQQSQLAAAHAAATPSAAQPIHIAPRASPRAAAGPSAAVAQSCPAFSWQPPAAPSARPRIASIEPPPMELPPSPPVFSPMQAEAVKGRKDEGGALALKKQIYSRSLSNSANYSSSAPTHVDYLSKFQPNLGQLAEGAAAGDDSDDEEDDRSAYRPSARAQGQKPAPFGLGSREDAEADEPTAAGAVGIKSSRVTAVARGDDFSLSKSPTIFSILSTSQHGSGHSALGLGLGNARSTAEPSLSSSTSSGSPGHAILGAIAAGDNVKPSSRAQPPMQQHASSRTQAQPAVLPGGRGAPKKTSSALDDDDLQFNIQLDDQDGEGEDAGKQHDFDPLY